MGIPERHPFHGQVIRQVGGSQVALLRSSQHGLAIHLYRGNQLEVCMQAQLQRIHRVEQTLLILLIIPVVSQWLPLHDSQHGHQVAIHTACLAAYQFRRVRVLLLRHDGRTGT